MRKFPPVFSTFTLAFDEAGDDDEELDAECRFLGSLMLKPDLIALPQAGVPLTSFSVPFHAAVYHALMLLATLGRQPIPIEVWELVKGHPDAECFGLDHVNDLAVDAAQPDSFGDDMTTLIFRGFAVASKRLGMAA